MDGWKAVTRCARNLFEVSRLKLTLAMVSIDLVGAASDMIHF